MPCPAACKPRGCNANTSNAISSSTGTAPHLARVRKSTPSFHPYLISIIWAMHCSSQITSNSTLLLCPVVNGIADNTHVLPSLNSAPLSTVPLNKACLMAAPVALQILPAPRCLSVSGWLPLPKWEFPSSSAKEREISATLERAPLGKQPLHSSGQLQYGKNNHCKKLLHAWQKST